MSFCQELEHQRVPLFSISYKNGKKISSWTETPLKGQQQLAQGIALGKNWQQTNALQGQKHKRERLWL